MIFTQIFSIKMTKTNAERQRVYCERKKVKEGSKYLEKNAEKTKAILQENQRTFYERTEGTKRNSKNGAYKNIAYRKNKPLTQQWSLLLQFQSHIIHHTFDFFHVICELRWVVKKVKVSKQWSAIQKNRKVRERTCPWKKAT